MVHGHEGQKQKLTPSAMLIEIRHKGLETFQIYNLSMVVVKKIPTIERQTCRKGTRKVGYPETP
jgi:hypothetical protein